MRAMISIVILDDNNQKLAQNSFYVTGQLEDIIGMDIAAGAQAMYLRLLEAAQVHGLESEHMAGDS